MPQSKHNTNMSISRKTHEELVKILYEKQEEMRKKSGLDVRYSLNDVVNMLVTLYKESKKGS